MTRLKRLGLAAVFASSMAIGLAVATPAGAATSGTSTAPNNITIGALCAKLSWYISALEERPASPLRDFLLNQARLLFERYCQ